MIIAIYPNFSCESQKKTEKDLQNKEFSLDSYDLLDTISETTELLNETNDVNIFPPDSQTPFFEKGLILPPDSLPCVPVSTGVPQNKCNHHGSTVTELPDGTIAFLWFHGEYEKSLDSRIVWSRLKPSAKEWTFPEILFDDPERSEGNSVLWVAGDGSFKVFFVSIWEQGWHQSKIRMISSNDQGKTWSQPVILRDELCWMARHHPLRLKNGEIILPLYDECLANPVFMYSKDDFVTWEEQTFEDQGAYFLDHIGQIQPSIVQIDDGTVVGLTRDGTYKKRIQRMTSIDNGRTWSKSEPLELPNSGTSIDQVKLLDGHNVIVFNNNPDDRFPLNAALSLDGSKTFTAIQILNDECPGSSCSFSYPSVSQSVHDGTIWVSYTYSRQTIGWIHFNEAWLAQGTEKANIKPITE
jgi:predicted neuraminidase